jgi:hypothetical protein
LAMAVTAAHNNDGRSGVRRDYRRFWDSKKQDRSGSSTVNFMLESFCPIR